MKTLFLILACVGVISKAWGQDGYGSTSVYDRVATLPKGKHLYIIPPNGKWDQQNWKDSVYRFEEFQTGRLEMSNDFIPSHRPMLNYNILLATIDIKQPAGTVVAMRASPAIKFVWIGDHKFINDPDSGYIEVILDGNISVAQKGYMKGIYELSNGNRYPISNLMATTIADVKTTRYFWTEEAIYLVDSKMKAVRAGGQVLKHLLRKHKSALKTFVKENHISYKKKDDILKVVAYANQLPD